MFGRRRKYYYPRETYRRQRRWPALFPRRKRRRGVWRLVGEFLSWFAFLSLITGAIIGAVMYFVHTRFDDALRTHVEAKFRAAYPNHHVAVHSARWIDGQGIELRGVSIAEGTNSDNESEIVVVDELLLQSSAGIEDLIAGKLNATQIVVRRMKLFAARGEDGQWNVSRLFPLPRLGTQQQVPVLLENCSAEFVQGNSADAKPLAVAIQQLKLSPAGPGEAGPANAPAKTWAIEATLSGPMVQQISVSGRYDVASTIWLAEGKVQGFKATPELAVWLPEECREHAAMINALQVSTNATFQATNEKATDGWCRFSVEGDVQGRVEDNRLPVAISDLKANFTSDGRSLRIFDLSARAGQAVLRGSCDIGGFRENAPCQLKLSAEKLKIDRQFVEAMPDEWCELWTKLAPEGFVDVEVALDFDGKAIRHSAIVDCREVSFAYYKFPYRLINGKGRVEWQNGVLKFKDFLAYASGREVHFDGEVENPGPDYQGYVEVRVQDAVPIDEKLIWAMPEGARRVAQQLHPEGAITLSARFERQHGDPPVARKELKIGLQDCSTHYDLFSYPLSHIRGMMTMRDDHWTVKDLEGVNDSAWVLCNGGWGPDEKGVLRLSLDFTATDVPLEDELREALRPNAQAVWNSIRPRGTIDQLKASVQYDSQSRKTSVEVAATKQPSEQNVEGRSITVKPTWLPYQLDEVEGTLRYRDGVTELQNVRGVHGDTLLQMKGVVTSTDEGWQVNVDPFSVDRLQVTHELTSALPKRLGEAISRLNISGPVNLGGMMVFQGVKGTTAPQSTHWDVDMDVENAGLDCGIQLDHVHGGLKLTGDLNQKGLSSRGWLEIDSLVYHGIQVTKVEGPLSLTDERLALGEWIAPRESGTHSRPVSGHACGGTVVGSGEVALSGDFPFNIEARMFDGDLATISREATSRRHDLSGRTSADLHLVGTNKGIHTLRGTGNVQLTDADIYKLPVMARLLKLLKVKPPDDTAFTSSDVKYHIEGDRIYLDKIHFDGDAISLDGTGDMTLDRAINLKLYTSLGNNDVRDFFVRPLLKEAGKQLLGITVTGTLEDPQVNREPLGNIRENIQSIFPGAPGNRPTMSRLPRPGDAGEHPSPPR